MTVAESPQADRWWRSLGRAKRRNVPVAAVRIRLAVWRRFKYSAASRLIEIARRRTCLPISLRLQHALAGAMSLSADALYKMSDAELLAAYDEARRELVEKKFTRDTNRARLAWSTAKVCGEASGGVTERNMEIDVSEQIARKGQELRETTRDLDLLKVDVDIIAIVIRLR